MVLKGISLANVKTNIDDSILFEDENYDEWERDISKVIHSALPDKNRILKLNDDISINIYISDFTMIKYTYYASVQLSYSYDTDKDTVINQIVKNKNYQDKIMKCIEEIIEEINENLKNERLAKIPEGTDTIYYHKHYYVDVDTSVTFRTLKLLEVEDIDWEELYEYDD